MYTYVYHVQLYIHSNFDMFAMFSSLIIDMTRIRGFLRQIWLYAFHPDGFKFVEQEKTVFEDDMRLPSGKLTWLWKIGKIGKTFTNGPLYIAMLNDQRVYQLWVVWWGWSSSFTGIPTQPSTHPSNQRRPLQGESETRRPQIFGFSGNSWLLCVWKWGYAPPKTATHKWLWINTYTYHF